MQNLLNPVEDLVQVLKTPVKLAERSSLNRQGNSVDIASGRRIAVNDAGCGGSGGDDPYDTQAYMKAQKMADSLATLLRNACGNMHMVAYSQEEYARWNEGVSDVMGYLGIDASKDFTVNGMKYGRNGNGWYESQADSEAKSAYEMLKAAWQKTLEETGVFAKTDCQTELCQGFVRQADFFCISMAAFHNIS